MNDAGATHYNDLTALGWPSTYLLDEEDLVEIFDTLDLKYANNPANYWIVELADGLLQRETAMLLANPIVRARIDRLVLCATDTFAAIGGLRVLDDHFGLEPDAISGMAASSQLGVRERDDRRTGRQIPPPSPSRWESGAGTPQRSGVPDEPVRPCIVARERSVGRNRMRRSSCWRRPRTWPPTRSSTS